MREFADNIWRVYRFSLACTYPGRTLVITNEAGDPEVSFALWQRCPHKARILLQRRTPQNQVTTGGVWA